MRGANPSARLVAWCNAWLTGHVGLDEAVDAVERVSGPHVVDGISGESGEVSLRRGLGTLRVAGMTAVRLALPVAGDPLGLPGPPSLNSRALESGEAAIAEIPGQQPTGLVPAEDRRGSSYVGIRWTAHEARPGIPDVPSLPEADHQLSDAVRAATETLLSIDDVASWRPEIAEALASLREAQSDGPAAGLAPGYPARAHRLAAMAGRLSVVVDLARDTDCAHLSASQMRRRAEALRDLDRAVRRARVAAHNSVLDYVP